MSRDMLLVLVFGFLALVLVWILIGSLLWAYLKSWQAQWSLHRTMRRYLIKGQQPLYRIGADLQKKIDLPGPLDIDTLHDLQTDLTDWTQTIKMYVLTLHKMAVNPSVQTSVKRNLEPFLILWDAEFDLLKDHVARRIKQTTDVHTGLYLQGTQRVLITNHTVIQNLHIVNQS